MGHFAGSTWALILAGGDGARLRPLTMQISGDALDRVIKSLTRARRRPSWLERVELASAA